MGVRGMVVLWTVALLIGPSATLARAPSLQQQGEEFVEQLAAGALDGAVASFDDSMAAAMPAPRLDEVWQQLQAQVGGFQRRGPTRTETHGGYTVVFVTCVFDRGTLDAKVVYDGEGRVAGLFFVPSAPPVQWSAPAYADPASFTERELTVGEDPWTLPGTLTMPVGAGPFPAVVLVHGSGPNDRDETMGANKPFCDLAWGLASRGVAVLRYDKRTLVHGGAMEAVAQEITVAEETLDDAVSAVAILRGTEGIDPERVWVAGHSLGAQLVPRIAEASPASAGFIALAAPARPLEQLIVDQLSYIAQVDGTVDEHERRGIEEATQQVARIADPELGPETPAESLPFGVPAAYWLDLRGYEPHVAARGIERPLLVLQGERDYQVTMVDFTAWREALAGRDNVTLVSFPDLNHLFIAGEGPSTPAEYQQPGHVAVEVVEAIAAFVRGLS
jgi:uncharacterized protein